MLAHFHRHGHVDPRHIVTLVDEAGFNVIDQGAIGISSLQYFLAKTASRAHKPHGRGWIATLAILLLVAAHVVLLGVAWWQLR